MEFLISLKNTVELLKLGSCEENSWISLLERLRKLKKIAENLSQSLENYVNNTSKCLQRKRLPRKKASIPEVYLENLWIFLYIIIFRISHLAGKQHNYTCIPDLGTQDTVHNLFSPTDHSWCVTVESPCSCVQGITLHQGWPRGRLKGCDTWLATHCTTPERGNN